MYVSSTKAREGCAFDTVDLYVHSCAGEGSGQALLLRFFSIAANCNAARRRRGSGGRVVSAPCTTSKARRWCAPQDPVDPRSGGEGRGQESTASATCLHWVRCGLGRSVAPRPGHPTQPPHSQALRMGVGVDGEGAGPRGRPTCCLEKSCWPGSSLTVFRTGSPRSTAPSRCPPPSTRPRHVV